eukprot:7378294-Prymnesium_polylepis.1
MPKHGCAGRCWSKTLRKAASLRKVSRSVDKKLRSLIFPSTDRWRPKGANAFFMCVCTLYMGGSGSGRWKVVPRTGHVYHGRLLYIPALASSTTTELIGVKRDLLKAFLSP